MRFYCLVVSNPRLFWTVVLFMTATLLSSCSYPSNVSEGGPEPALSPITDNPSGSIYPGKFVWHDLLTPDVVSAGKFYEELFGWQIEYKKHSAVIRNNGKRIAGLLEVPSSESRVRGIWIPSVSIEDVDGALQLVVAKGGQILNGPVDAKSRGRVALIRDFQGADLVLLHAKGGDPVESEAATGDWLWDEIWTHSPAETERFYTSILGYDDIFPARDDYGVFVHEDEWMAGIRHLEEDTRAVLWMPVVRVADPEASVKRVEDLGGVVWVTPDQAPDVGNTALISDPTGSMLLIQRWPSQSSDKVK